jgi:hypothetical protein
LVAGATSLCSNFQSVDAVTLRAVAEAVDVGKAAHVSLSVVLVRALYFCPKECRGSSEVVYVEKLEWLGHRIQVQAGDGSIDRSDGAKPLMAV